MKNRLSIAMVSLIMLSIFSMLTPKVESASETIIFRDDFEAYPVGGFPSVGGWELVWNGKGTAYQVVTDVVGHSPTKSLRLWGQPGWSANVEREFTSSSEAIGFEVYVRTKSNTGAGWKVAGACFWKLESDVPWGKRFADVAFGPDGQLYTRPVKGSSSYFPLGFTYEANTWYKVGVIIDRTAETYDVWIDDILLADDVVIWDTYEIDALMLESGHSSIEVYFDDVTVFEGSRFPVHGLQDALREIADLWMHVQALYDEGAIEDYKRDRILGSLGLVYNLTYGAMWGLDTERLGFDDLKTGMECLYRAVREVDALVKEIWNWVEWGRMSSDLAEGIIEELGRIEMKLYRKARAEAEAERMLAVAAIMDAEARGRYVPWLWNQIEYIDRLLVQNYVLPGFVSRDVGYLKLAFYYSQRVVVGAWHWSWDIAPEDWVDQLEATL